MDDMNSSRFQEVRARDARNNSKLWMIEMILGHEFKALYVMNSSRVWITGTTLDHELKVINAMNSSKCSFVFFLCKFLSYPCN